MNSRPKATGRLLKVAWIRDPNAPAGQPATGRLNCRCGQAPITRLDPAQGNVRCACGQLYTYNGFLL